MKVLIGKCLNNNYLTEKDLKFIEALKEDHRINGDKSFFKTLFAGLDWSDTDIFKEDIAPYNSPNPDFVGMIDWIFSYGETYFIGKYKDWFFLVDNEGISGPIGKDFQNLIDFTLDYYGDREDIIDFESTFFEYTKSNYKEILNSFSKLCLGLGIDSPLMFKFDESQNEGFDYELFDNM